MSDDNFHLKIRNLDILSKYVRQGNVDQFMSAIDNMQTDDLDLNMKDTNDNYLIILAATHNLITIVKKISDLGARLDVYDLDGKTIFYNVIKYGHDEMMKVLLECDKSSIGIKIANIEDKNGDTPIFYALGFKNNKALKRLIEAGSILYYKNAANLTPLHFSVGKKDFESTKILLDNAPRKLIDYQNNNGLTALNIATLFELNRICELLLINGANPNIAENTNEFTPIFNLITGVNIGLLNIFLQYDINPNHQDREGNTFLHLVIANKKMQFLDIFMNHFSIETPSSISVYSEYINNRKQLITSTTKRININLINIDGETTLHLMLYNYTSEYDVYVEKMLPYANLNYQDNRGNTILHLLSQNNIWVKFQNILIQKKLNIYIQNNDFKTPFDYVNPNDKSLFIEITSKSYEYQLGKTPNVWQNSWQNNCSVNMDEKCKTLIKKDVQKNNISIPIPRDRVNITIDIDNKTQFTTFTGSLLDIIVGFKYLTKKYPNTAMIISRNAQIDPDLERFNISMGIQENVNQHLTYFEIRWFYQKLFLPPNFQHMLEIAIKSKKYRYIIVPIGIILSNGHHSNGLFIDLENKSIERFEPHGSNYPNNFNYNPDLFDNMLAKKFKDIFEAIDEKSVDITYLSPKDYLPKIGFQTLDTNELHVNKNIGDPNGFCSLWTIWFLDYRIRYANMNPNKLVVILINSIRASRTDTFRGIMRNYSTKITDLRDNYLEKNNYHINDYLNDKMDQPDLEKLLTEIILDK